MTNEQYEKYKSLSEELVPVKQFLNFCGDKYHNGCYGWYKFKILTKLKEFFMFAETNWGSMEERSYRMPKELQQRIVKVIEEYVDEKEEELKKI